MKYYIIAGELSGDIHTSLIIRHIKSKDKQAVFRCWGGDNMKKEGGELVRHIKDLAFMGFFEVLLHLKTVLNNLKFCKKDIIRFNPDALILTDYPGFNLRIAKFAYKHNYKVYYYVSPQVWAWKKNRIKTIKKVITKLFVILPFEKEFYKQHNVDVMYYGNPLLDEIAEFRQRKDNRDKFIEDNELQDKPVIALLPGSRKQEIDKILPLQMKIIEKYEDEFNFIIAGVTAQREEVYKKHIDKTKVKIIFDNTYNILNIAKAAVVASGTATLETALFNVPQVVSYRSSWLSYIIATYIVKIKYVSLVNIIMKKKVVTELLQYDYNEKNILTEFEKIVYDRDYIKSMKEDYRELEKLLGDKGSSERMAEYIVTDLIKK